MRRGFDELSDILTEINQYGPFNCLFSDGEYLFAYKDYEGRRDLHFLENPREKGFIITTNPLTNENWESFRNGELIVFKNGKMIYSNR